MPWDPELYRRFQAERSAPFEDLVGLIDIRPGMRVIDLGCGTGELTAKLADRLPGSDVLGIDGSGEMLSRAGELVHPTLHFELGRIEDVEGEWDLVFSNAAIQWVEDHAKLIPRLLSLLKPGGQLAVQLPSNHHHASHALMRQTAQEEPFQSALESWTRTSPALPLEQYAELLYEAGGQSLTIFQKVYPHVLENSGAVAEWMSGTALVPYLERLPETLRPSFMQRYRAKLAEVWPSGPVFFPFKRILFAATRSTES